MYATRAEVLDSTLRGGTRIVDGTVGLGIVVYFNIETREVTLGCFFVRIKEITINNMLMNG